MALTRAELEEKIKENYQNAESPSDASSKVERELMLEIVDAIFDNEVAFDLYRKKSDELHYKRRSGEVHQTLRVAHWEQPSAVSFQTGSSAIPSGVLWLHNGLGDGLFKFYGSQMVEGISSSFLTTGGKTSPDQENLFTVDFMTDADDFEIITYGNGRWFRGLSENLKLSVDLQLAVDAQVKYYRFEWAAPYMSHYSFEFEDFGEFAGIVLPPGYRMIAPPVRRGPRIICVGDSQTYGQDLAQRYFAYPNLLGRILEADVWNSGSSGTGYVKAEGGRVNIRDRVQADVIAHNPDAVIWFAGTNDELGLGTDPDENAFKGALRATWGEARAALPNCRNLVVPTLDYSDTPLAPNTNQWQKEVAEDEFGWKWVDPYILYAAIAATYVTGHWNLKGHELALNHILNDVYEQLVYPR